MKTNGESTLPLWPGSKQDHVGDEKTCNPTLEIVRLYRSEGHNYFGHHQLPPGENPIIEATQLELVAGEGVVGDRFFRYKRGYGGQVTFFAIETWERLIEELGHADRHPGVFRRNVVTRGVDLLSLVNQEFEVQGVKFSGTEHCRPCAWMDLAFGPGTFARLREWRAGGLRARVRSSGELTVSKNKDIPCLAP